MKRLLAIVLVAAMIISLVSMSVFSVSAETLTDEQGVQYTLSDDGTYYIISDCDPSAIEVVIPEKYNSLPVKEIGDSAFAYCYDLTNIIIPDSIISIGDTAFRACRNLKSITIPDLVTVIGAWTFSSCSSLTSISIPDSVTSIGYYAFDHCEKLTNIKIPNSVTSIGDIAFSACFSLTSITIPDSVTSMGSSVFSLCSNLTDIYCEVESKPQNWHTNWLGDYSAAKVHWGVFGSNSGYGTIKFGDFSVIWDERLENMFRKDPSQSSFSYTVEWKELAMLSGVLSGNIYGDNFDRIKTALNALNIPIIEYNETSEFGKPGYVFGYKQIICGGEKKTLIIAIFRGTNNEMDRLTDITQVIGGMNVIANGIYQNEFKDYLAHLEEIDIDTNNAVFLVTGHSLGGAIANTFAWELTSEVGAENVFAYTFAAPLTTLEEKRINNISNFVSVSDVFTHMGMGIIGISVYRRYGKVYIVYTPKGFSAAHSLNNYLKGVYELEGVGYPDIKLQGVLVQCPVDVELLDESGNVVGRIINNKVTDDTVVPACVIGDDKYFFYEDEGVYTVKLYGTDIGSMTYTVFTKNVEEEVVTQFKKWTNIDLYDGKTMAGKIYSDTNDSILYLEDQSGISGVINQDGTEIVLQTASGDVNSDGLVNQYDYILVKRHYFGTRVLSEIEMALADVNFDSKVDQYDYILICRHYFGTYVIG